MQGRAFYRRFFGGTRLPLQGEVPVWPDVYLAPLAGRGPPLCGVGSFGCFVQAGRPVPLVMAGLSSTEVDHKIKRKIG